MDRKLLVMTILLLTGCQTMQRHPVATGVVVSVLATSVALSANHGHGNRQGPDVSLPNAPNCSDGSCK
jgi:hypothetical protein